MGLGEFDFPKGSFTPLRTAREVNAAIRGKEDMFFSLPFISVEDAIGDLPVLNPGKMSSLKNEIRLLRRIQWRLDFQE